MESSVLQRISEFISANGYNVRSFSKKIGMPQTTLNNYILKKRSLSFEVIDKIINSFEDISAEWLLRGEGSMYRITEDDQPLSNAEKLLAEFAYQTELIVKERDEEIRKLRLENAMLVAEANVRKAG